MQPRDTGRQTGKRQTMVETPLAQSTYRVNMTGILAAGDDDGSGRSTQHAQYHSKQQIVTATIMVDIPGF